MVYNLMADSQTLSVAVDETSSVREIDSDFEILPYHVETLQTLSLQIAASELSGEPLNPHVLMQIWDQVKTLCDEKKGPSTGARPKHLGSHFFLCVYYVMRVIGTNNNLVPLTTDVPRLAIYQDEARTVYSLAHSLTASYSCCLALQYLLLPLRELGKPQDFRFALRPNAEELHQRNCLWNSR